jgi:hypothetical protein
MAETWREGAPTITGVGSRGKKGEVRSKWAGNEGDQLHRSIPVTYSSS